MAKGCTNPTAKNYDPNATEDDGSCIYLNKVAGVCYAFQDVAPGELIDRSFTMSWSVVDNSWVFFHDYIPDFYFSTRERLFNVKSGQFFEHNVGAPGVFHDQTAPKPFFIDVVFHTDKELTLNAINWITEVLNADGSTAPFDTLTHITVWNSYQCSGRIAISDVYQNLEYEARKLQGRWSFNDFRNQLATQGVAFLKDLFGNFAIADGAIADLPWYEQQLLEDNYFVVRFEFDNTSGKRIFLLDTDVDIDDSKR